MIACINVLLTYIPLLALCRGEQYGTVDMAEDMWTQDGQQIVFLAARYFSIENERWKRKSPI